MMSLLTFLRREPAVAVAYLLLAAILVGWAVSVPQLSILSVTNTIGQKLPIVCVTIGAAIVLISRGVDLSVGATLTLVNVIIAKGADGSDAVFLWIVVAMAASLAAGLVNGILVAVYRLSPLIVTLATSSVLFGIALYIMPIPGGGTPSWFTRLPLLLVGPVPLVALLLVLIPVVLWWPLKRSPLGADLYAVGNDEAAAFTAGIRVRATLASAYVLAAFFAGLGGVFLTMNAGSGDAGIGLPYTLTSIAGAVIGGVALSGGRGTIAGAVAGALIMSFLNNLLFAIGVSTYWQFVVTGVLLLLALSVPLAAHRLLARTDATA